MGEKSRGQETADAENIAAAASSKSPNPPRLVFAQPNIPRGRFGRWGPARPPAGLRLDRVRRCTHAVCRMRRGAYLVVTYVSASDESACLLAGCCSPLHPLPCLCCAAYGHGTRPPTFVLPPMAPSGWINGSACIWARKGKCDFHGKKNGVNSVYVHTL